MVDFPIDKTKLKQHNIAKYKGVPPPWELIEKVIEKSGLKRQYKFELVWNIPRKLLTQYKNGDKVLPCKYWHIFYEFDALQKSAKRKIKERAKKPTAASVKILETNKNILDEFRQELAER